MLQHLDIDIGLEDELEQDDDHNQQQKDEADQDNTGSQTDGDDSSETPTTLDGEDSEGEQSDSSDPHAGKADSDMMEGEGEEIGTAHVSTPVTNAHLVCTLLREKT